MTIIILNRTIKVIKNNKTIYLKKEELCFCKSEGCYSMIFTKSGDSYLISKTLKKIQILLPEKIFIRCHRSYLVNMEEIIDINFHELQIHQKLYQIPVSNAKIGEVLYKYLIYLNNGNNNSKSNF